MPTSTGPLQILDNKNGIVNLIWERDKTGLTKFYRLYSSNRKSGTFTLFADNIQNAVGYGNRYVRFDLDRSKYGIELESQVYFYLTEVDWYGVETPTPVNPVDFNKVKILYEDGITLTSSMLYREVDYQAAAAVDIDFSTTDRFNGLISHVLLTRDTTDPIDVTVSLTCDSTAEDIVIGKFFNYTQPFLDLAQNQQFPELQHRRVRIQTSGVSGGFLQVIVSRRRMYIYEGIDY